MSTSKFSDFPHYMLSDYFTNLASFYSSEELKEALKEDKNSIIKLEDSVQFTELFLNFNPEGSFLSTDPIYDTIESRTKNIRIKAPNHSIVVNGSEYTTFYAKIKNYGYKPIKLKPVSTGNFIDKNWFNFDKASSDECSPGLWDKEEIENLFSKKGESLPDDIQSNEKPSKINVAERIDDSNAFLYINEISTNDPEIDEVVSNFEGKITDQIDIFQSKESKSYAIKYWKMKYIGEDIKLQPEDEIYLRSDSFFFDWYRKELKNYGDVVTDFGTKILTKTDVENLEYFPWNHENFLNENLMFSFVGCCWKIWPYEEKWKIQHRTIKDFMINALPENDLSSGFKIYAWELFDRVYHEIYSQQKNFYTLLDPEEINEKFLGYLSQFYGIDVDMFNKIPYENKRWFVINLPFLLKKKGTWNSLKIIWEILLRKQNKLSLYERWHDKYSKSIVSHFELNNTEVVDYESI